MPWIIGTHTQDFELVTQTIQRLGLPLELYRPTVLKEPLFFDYLFARKLAPIDLHDHSLWLPIRWVMFGDRFAELSDGTIEEIKSLTAAETDAARRSQSGPEFGERNRGRVVEITAGVFGGIYGKVLRAGKRGTVVVEIRFVGRPTECTVAAHDVRLVERRTVQTHQSGQRLRSGGIAAAVESASEARGIGRGDRATDDDGAGVVSHEV